MADTLPLVGAEWGPGLPPSWLFLAAAFALAAFGSWPRARAAVLLLTPLVGAANLATLAPGASWTFATLELELVLLRVDRLSLLFGLLFHIAALLGAIYALRAKDRLEHAAAFAYAGGALGAVFAGDLVTLFVYWEIMAVASAFVIFAARTPASSGAGLRYLVLQLLSGLLLLAGALLHYRTSGTIEFEAFDAGTAAGALILLAFGIKCGFPLLHSWIVDAYPQATPSGTVFLSMFTTKVAVYALVRGFTGTEILVPIGTAMAVLPIFYAVIENDLRRVLCYSMINQIGFMVAGVGIGTELALNGAVAHAFNEVLFKGLLFMTMGAVLARVGHALGSDLGGLYRSMPATTALCVVGAASISAFPLFSGFVSKSMIMAAMVETGHAAAWFALLFASAGVFHHAGIKIPYFAFFAHDSGLRVREAPGEMLVAMAIAAAGCVLVGVYPAVLYGLLPWPVSYVPYTYPHVVVQLQLLLYSALAFAWLKLSGIYPAELRSVNLDVDWLYRRAASQAWRAATASSERAKRTAANAGVWSLVSQLRSLGMAESLARPRGSGVAALLTGLLLAGYLLLHYLGVGRP